MTNLPVAGGTSVSITHLGRAVLPIVHDPNCKKPDVRNRCDCGENRSCLTCGWGNASSPCTCQRKRMEVKP